MPPFFIGKKVMFIYFLTIEIIVNLYLNFIQEQKIFFTLFLF